MSLRSPGRSRRALLSFGLAVSFAVLTASCGKGASDLNDISASDPQPVTATFYLVRHAEKELIGDDPALSDAGYARAQALSEELRGVKLDGIYSTDTRRTRDTAAPTLARTNLSLQIYDGRALSEFAQQLSSVKGNYLIVGHSNTTPQLAEALGGEGGDPIVEANEYDRLYVLRRSGGGVVTELRRFP